MDIELLKPEEIEQLYFDKMRQDFPPSELRPLSSIKNLIQQNSYLCFAHREKGHILAYAAFAITDGGVLLDYYAVDKTLRGQGLGSRFLSALKNSSHFPGASYLMIEVESIESAQNSEEILLRQRRIRFYERCGCRLTGVYSSLFGVEYRILFLPFSSYEPSDEEIKGHLERAYRTMITPLVTGEEDYQKNCQVYFSQKGKNSPQK